MHCPNTAIIAAILTALIAAGFSPVSAQVPEIYDFESLPIHNFIDGEDNWVDKPGQGDGVIWLDEAGNDTQIARPLPTVAFNEDVFLARANDSSFSFPAFNSSSDNAVIRFELNGEHIALFGLGHDLDGDGILEEDPFGNGSGGELGPVFGDDDRNFFVREASFGQTTTAPFGGGNSYDDWYRMELRIDFTANGGEGSGSLFYLNISDGETEFQPVNGLQDLNLQLGRLHADAGPGSWDTMWLQLRSYGSSRAAAVDNLVPNATPGAVETVSAEMACLPDTGILPLVTNMTAVLNNIYTDGPRRIAGRIDVTIAGGFYFPNWKSGSTVVAAADSYIASWNQTIPAAGTLVGENLFTLIVEDVTSPPYNQPPYPAAGDTAIDGCTITGVAP